MRTFHRMIRDCFTFGVFFIILMITALSLLIQYPTSYEEDELQLGPIKDGNYPDEADDRLFWFLQITDLHLSHIDVTYRQNFLDWLITQRYSIDPLLVMATGDLTDAHVEYRASMLHQSRVEWEQYQRCLLLSGALAKDAHYWIDVAGNHDFVGLRSRDLESNYYYQYSPNAKELDSANRPRVYRYTYNTTLGEYDFISIDFSQDPITTPVYSFYGIDSTEILDELEAKLRTDQVQQTILFSHYPLSYVAQRSRTSKTGKSLKDLIKDNRALVYLSGHAHLTKMYSQYYGGQNGILEMELEDFKVNQYYRIVSIDNNLFNFVDVKAGDGFPIILITNPKSSKYFVKSEPLQKIGQSTHIRVLIFEDRNSTNAEDGIKSVKAIINEEEDDDDENGFERPMSRAASNSTLWVCPWDPSFFTETSKNVIKIVVELNSGEVVEREQFFNVEMKGKSKGLSPGQMVQRIDIYRFWYSIFIVGWLLSFVRLCLIPTVLKYILNRKGVDIWESFQETMVETVKNDEYTFKDSFKIHFKYGITKYGSISRYKVVALFICGLSVVCLPITVAQMLDETYWGQVWVWGGCVDGDCTVYTMAFWIASVYIWGVYYPGLEAIAMIEIAKYRQLKGYDKNFWKPVLFWFLLNPLFWTGFLLAQATISYSFLGFFFSFGIVWPCFILNGIIFWSYFKYYWYNHRRKKRLEFEQRYKENDDLELDEKDRTENKLSELPDKGNASQSENSNDSEKSLKNEN
ncbi:transmembrane protein [Anaeramoeba flamelloides]|uniref:Transmembrane protein n=1 Tax=Anaeramoeba flamelloides TaxID=1746091 RepID=A0ABQ8XEX8_9EUKA|nr:transmembrane protein [Anaeramoeba flamelloides]